MSNVYHVTMSQGRSDTFVCEAINHKALLTFLNTFSTAIVTNIKKIVYSVEHNINHTTIIKNDEPYYKSVIVMCKSQNYAKNITLYFVRKSVSKDDILRIVKKMYLLDEPITDIYNISFFE